jgi:hypothetical protein
VGKRLTKKKASKKSSARAQAQAALSRRMQRSRQLEKWTPPRDMPKTLIKKVRAGKACGALKTNGKYCWNPPADPAGRKKIPFRCAQHGGLATGAPKGTRNGVAGGIYAECLFDDEIALWDSLRADDLTEEIMVSKLRLKRALKAERMQETILASLDEEERRKALEDHEYVSELRIKDGEIETHEKKTRKVRDYARQVHLIANELRAFVQCQLELLGAGAGSAEDSARAVRDFVASMREDME